MVQHYLTLESTPMADVSHLEAQYSKLQEGASDSKISELDSAYYALIHGDSRIDYDKTIKFNDLTPFEWLGLDINTASEEKVKSAYRDAVKALKGRETFNNRDTMHILNEALNKIKTTELIDKYKESSNEVEEVVQYNFSIKKELENYYKAGISPLVPLDMLPNIARNNMTEEQSDALDTLIYKNIEIDYTKLNVFEQLAVTPNSSSDEIRKSFLRNSLALHTQESSRYGIDTSKQFVMFTEANELLRDPETFKAEANKFKGGLGASSIFNKFNKTDGKATQGKHVRQTVPIDFSLAVNGGSVPIKIASIGKCYTCEGTGKVDTGGHYCTTCDNTREVTITSKDMFGNDYDAQSRCQDCLEAAELSMKVKCKECNGEGEVQRTIDVEIEIPKGTPNGKQLVKEGAGEKVPNGMNGDLIITIEVKEDSRFKPNEDNPKDIDLEIYLSYSKFVLGCSLEIPRPNGETLQYDIAPLTPPNAKQRFRHAGMPVESGMPGNLYVTFKLEMPNEVTDEMKTLLEELDK